MLELWLNLSVPHSPLQEVCPLKTRRESIKEFTLQILLLIAFCAALLAVGIPLILFLEWLTTVAPLEYLYGGLILLIVAGFIACPLPYKRFFLAYLGITVLMVLSLVLLWLGISQFERFLFGG